MWLRRIASFSLPVTGPRAQGVAACRKFKRTKSENTKIEFFALEKSSPKSSTIAPLGAAGGHCPSPELSYLTPPGQWLIDVLLI
jgi:hypothetical protein